jgi:hypothetical protein
MNKRFIALVLSSLALFLFSCQTASFQSGPSSSLASSSASDEQTSLSTSSSNTPAYSTDSEGFYILENGYFDYHEDSTDQGKRNKLSFANASEGVLLYSQARLYAGGQQIPLYNVKANLNHIWSAAAPGRVDSGVASVDMEGKILFSLQTNFPLNNTCVIRPLAAKVVPVFDDTRRVIRFVIDNPGSYTVELSAKRAIHLFVNAIGGEDATKSKATITFGPGIHNHANDARIDANNLCRLSSNAVVYLAPGCLFQGGFAGDNSSNITIGGSGFIDGSSFERNADNGSKLIPLDFNFCTNLTFSGFSVLDPAGWCFNLYFGNTIAISNVKIISSRSNGDGISIQSCQNVEVKGCFVRSWDDSLVVKNYNQWSNPSIEGTTRHVHFSSCRIWTDLAQSMEIGYETIGSVMDDITFTDITILHAYHLAPISIHNANNAKLTNVAYTNITVEDASLDPSNNKAIDFSTAFSSTWSTSHKTTALGSVDTVTLQNVLFIGGNDSLVVSIKGAIDTRTGYNNSEHDISNVSLTDVSIKGTLITKSYPQLATAYAPNLSFASSGNEITGSAYQTTTGIEDYGWNIDVL